jgi:hypothetical protein
MSVADDLQKLATLKADGVLTDPEFQHAKARLLQGDQPPAPPSPTVAQTADKVYRLYVTAGAYTTLFAIIAVVIFLVVFILKD